METSKGREKRTGEMTQQLRPLAALPEDLSSVSITLIRWLTTSCNFSFRGSHVLSWPLRAHTDTYTHIEFWDSIPRHSPGWPGTQYSHASASWVLRLKACTTILSPILKHCFSFCFWRQGFSNSPECPRTHSGNQAGLELRNKGMHYPTNLAMVSLK